MNIAIGVGIAFAILLIIAICCMIIFYRRYVLPRFISYFFVIIFDLKISGLIYVVNAISLIIIIIIKTFIVRYISSGLISA